MTAGGGVGRVLDVGKSDRFGVDPGVGGDVNAVVTEAAGAFDLAAGEGAGGVGVLPDGDAAEPCGGLANDGDDRDAILGLAAKARKGALFAAIKETLLGQRESQPYAELTQSLGMKEGALKVAVHRLRKRYRELIRAEIANTLDGSEDVEAELWHLFQVLTN